MAAGVGHGMTRFLLGASAVEEDPDLYAELHPRAEFVESPGADHFQVIEPDGHAWTIARKWLADKLS